MPPKGGGSHPRRPYELEDPESRKKIPRQKLEERNGWGGSVFLRAGESFETRTCKQTKTEPKTQYRKKTVQEKTRTRKEILAWGDFPKNTLILTKKNQRPARPMRSRKTTLAARNRTQKKKGRRSSQNRRNRGIRGKLELPQYHSQRQRTEGPGR